MESFNKLPSKQLNKEVAYICYDWREIPAIQACAWGRNPDINMLAVQQNLPFVTDAYQELSYVGALAKTALKNGQYRGEQDYQTLLRLKGTMSDQCSELLSLSVKDVQELDVSQFSQKYDGNIALDQVTDIIRGWRYCAQVWTLRKYKGIGGISFYGSIWVQSFNNSQEPQGQRVVIWSTNKSNCVTLKMNTKKWINKEEEIYFEKLARAKDTAYIQLGGGVMGKG